MTNLKKSREEIIYELILSLNQWNSGYTSNNGDGTPRVDLAIAQYEAMKKRGIIKEEP